MKLLNRLERSFGPFAIPHVTLYIVFLQSLAYVLMKGAEARNPEHADAFIQKLSLVADVALHGEPWRFVTFVLMPPVMNPLFFFFAMYLLFLMGSALESHWGTFRYNVFLIVGWIATILAALVLPTRMATNGYLMESIFLAFAYLYPDFELLLFFLFPVKVKWLALLTWIVYFYQFTTGEWIDKLLILAAIANFLLFFHKELWQTAKGGHRRMQNKAKFTRPVDEPFHTCAICGVTDLSNRKMEFRYCGQCAGTPCYCINHINAHQHRTAATSASPPVA